MDLAKINIYRITHIANVPHILRFGITHKESPNANVDFRSIGDTSLIETRNNKKVTVDNGDLTRLDAPTITLGDFIPFYFGVRMPMLYVIQQGGNFVEKATHPENIIYLACSLSSIINSNENIHYFTDGHATDSYTIFYDPKEIGMLPKIIDWEAVKNPYWGGLDNLNIKRKKQAEFLVKGDVHTKHIVGFGCYNEVAKDRLVEMGIKEDKIKIITQAYY